MSLNPTPWCEIAQLFAKKKKERLTAEISAYNSVGTDNIYYAGMKTSVFSLGMRFPSVSVAIRYTRCHVQ